MARYRMVNMKWYDTKQYDKKWYNTKRYHMKRYDTKRHDTKWSIQIGTIRNGMLYETARYETVWYKTVQYKTEQYEMVGHEAKRYDTIRYDVIRYFTIWYHKSSTIMMVSQYSTSAIMDKLQVNHWMIHYDICLIEEYKTTPKKASLGFILQSRQPKPRPESIETKFRSLVYSARHAYNEMWNLQTIGSPETDQKRSTFI